MRVTALTISYTNFALRVAEPLLALHQRVTAALSLSDYFEELTNRIGGQEQLSWCCCVRYSTNPRISQTS